MSSPPSEDPYFLEHLRRALAEDERVGEATLRVVLAGGRIRISGTVGSEERRQAAETVVREIAPGFPVANEVTVLVVGGPAVETVAGR
jgi:osmotically-inducible protein OsmY